MAEYPAMPLFTDAIIADCMHLTGEEFGHYMRLLIFCWRTTDCRLPNDDLRLRTMLGLTPKKWLSIKPILLSFFVEIDNELMQKKLTKVRRAVQQSVEQKRDAGLRSVEAKRLRSFKAKSTGVATGVATGNERALQQPKPNLSKDKGREAFLVFWAEQIKEGKRVPQTALKPNDVREIAARNLVSPEQLLAAGIRI